MAIQKLSEFAEIGDKNLTGIDMQQGFIQAEKPARQWFNSLFNSTIKKVNEVITAIDSLIVSTDKIEDGAVTGDKIATASITGDKIAKSTELNTPKLSATYALTTLDAPNLVLAADGTLRTTTRKAGIIENDLVVRGADGYPTNNNAIGVGQTWQDVKALRVAGTTYTNSTGRPIQVLFSGGRLGSPPTEFYINGVLVSSWGGSEADENSVCAVIPNGNTYKYVNAPTSFFSFWELR